MYGVIKYSSYELKAMRFYKGYHHIDSSTERKLISLGIYKFNPKRGSERTTCKLNWMTDLAPAAFAPLADDGGLQLNVIPDYASFLVNNSIHYVYINGYTGEGLSLTVPEREAITEHWVVAAKKRKLKVMSHIGADSIKESKELASHAEKVGVDCIAALSPLFFKPANEDELIHYFKEIATAAPNTPFLYYHLPAITGVKLDVTKFIPACKAAIPSFVGIKMSVTDMLEVSRALKAANESDVKILLGSDELLLCGLTLGINASIGSTFNFMPQIYHRLRIAFNKGDHETARCEQRKALDAIDIIFKYGHGTSALKAAMNLITPVTVGPPRSPLIALSQDKIESMKKELKSVGFFDWIKP